jgi:hypothetical protein
MTLMSRLARAEPAPPNRTPTDPASADQAQGRSWSDHRRRRGAAVNDARALVEAVVSNEIISHLDWLLTLLSAAGDPDVKQKLLDGHEAEGETFRVHPDEYDFLPYLTGQAEHGPRTEFFYLSHDGELVAMRSDNWALVTRLSTVADAWIALTAAMDWIRSPSAKTIVVDTARTGIPNSAAAPP